MDTLDYSKEGSRPEQMGPEDRSERLASLRRTVWWCAVMMAIFAAASVLGVYFGLRSYQYERSASRSPTPIWDISNRLLLLAIVRKAVLAGAFFFFFRVLRRYAKAIEAARSLDTPDSSRSLLHAQAECWKVALLLAVLYCGWEITSAVASVLYMRI